MAAHGKKGDRGSIVIRREEVVEGGHHGGAWKVAYADFVTAMMAFFLLMWLLNATTEAQRRGLADYFAPTTVISTGKSGSGKPFGGHTPFEQGDMVSDRGTASIQPGRNSSQAPPIDDPDSEQAPDEADPSGAGDQQAKAAGGSGGQAVTVQPAKGPKAPGGGQAAAQAQSPTDGTHLAHAANPPPSTAQVVNEVAVKAATAQRERASFDRAAEQIRDAVRADPKLAELMNQLSIDQTPEGLRIQLLDEDRQPMFAIGSAVPNERARLLLQKVVPVLAKLSEDIAITGHTDAAPFRGEGRSNWDLSTERANATRRLLAEAGLSDERFKRISGNADRDPLLPADPLAAANRRIAIVVLRDQGAPK